MLRFLVYWLSLEREYESSAATVWQRALQLTSFVSFHGINFMLFSSVECEAGIIVFVKRFII
jgi:hypothetical protein